ncbi:MAG: glycosyltransferase [Proteobacteria bacterium]|nr:glycosyltransferase [Pseudomonadota bacterium]
MNRRIHIMHLLLSLETGGCENGVVNLINHMDADRFKVSVCCLNQTGELVERIHEDRRHVHLVEKEGRTGPRDLMNLRDFFLEQDVDIVHTHAFATLFIGYVGARLARVPIVLHGEHGIFYADKFRRIMMQKILFRLVDGVITVSGDLKHRLAKTFNVGEDLFQPIINGVDLDKFSVADVSTRNRLRASLGAPEDACLIGSVGRLVDVKRFDLLIDGLAALRRNGSNIHMIIIGDGPLRSDLQERIDKERMNDHFFLAGRKDNVNDYLSALDIFALTSDFEGISNTILEAMAVGLPVIASNVGGNPEIVSGGRTGLLFEAGDVDQFKEVANRLILDNALREKMGAAARNDIIRQFNLKRMVKEYEQAYLNLVRKKRLKHVVS